MLPKDLTSRVRRSNHHFHVVQEDIDVLIPFFPYDSDSLRQLKVFLNSPTHVDPSEKPSSNHNSTLQNLETIRLVELDQPALIATRRNSSKLNALLLDYLTKESPLGPTVSRRVKCGSMERLSPEDLCIFYRYSALLKNTKKIVQNLLILHYHYL